jgi:hypothetical protein
VINADGCWCDNTFHETTGDDITVDDDACLLDAAAADAKECEFRPCGGDSFHTAVYRLKNTGFARYLSPKVGRCSMLEPVEARGFGA